MATKSLSLTVPVRARDAALVAAGISPRLYGRLPRAQRQEDRKARAQTGYAKHKKKVLEY
jgi:hypothetical protein